MKKSNYNKVWKLKNGKTLAFNSMTCALAEVDEKFLDIYENFDSIDFDNLSDDQANMIDQMKEGHFVIDNDLDEIKQIEFRHYKGKYGNNGLGLTLAPTLACNFKCPYCYETPDSKVMDENVQAAIVKMADEALKRSDSLDITWYGGEPLLAKDLIWDMSSKFIEICEKRDADYGAYMVSNGYLFKEDDLEMLKKSRITAMQITIDGPPDVHNTRRVLHNDGETFDEILSNIKMLKNGGIKVNLRVNIDKTNIDRVPELLDILVENGLNSMPISFGQVTAYTEACSSISGSCLNTKEYADWNLQFQKQLIDKGFPASNYPYYPGIKANYCCADQINAFVVDPNGYMYKCWNNVGLKDEAVGNVKEVFNEIVDTKYAINHAKWLTNTPFTVEKCVECSLLPVCMGGCPHVSLQDGTVDCEKWIYNLDEVLEYTFDIK
ncbi:radical SAM/SPASM domain Clo7bot peptide maturase [Fusibacter sp. JL216-2]|uniref:radical SAM/SPASM domain Clo7bot peptide maturase n=1 Tax=Fusibacter sp. JL216-2 TaxID=3071453 RepID=UPI003D34D78F